MLGVFAQTAWIFHNWSVFFSEHLNVKKYPGWCYAWWSPSLILIRKRRQPHQTSRFFFSQSEGKPNPNDNLVNGCLPLRLARVACFSLNSDWFINLLCRISFLFRSITWSRSEWACDTRYILNLHKVAYIRKTGGRTTRDKSQSNLLSAVSHYSNSVKCWRGD